MILSLAVLLIVVSSTVGSAIVLGDRLWMAEGKCLLATAYTLMFAGFGLGLTRWGAIRAGRIMRLTTLILLPVDFALVGELPGLGKSSWGSLGVLALDSVAMMALAWRLCRSLGVSGGRGTPLALIAMGMVNALTPRSAGFSWAFSAMLGASAVFAVSGEWLAEWLARKRSLDKADESDAPYFAIGLLAFYFACAIGRVGGYVLHLTPTLFSLPAMLAAWAAVRVSEGLADAGHPQRPVALVRLSGYALSALAFALGMARPEVNDAIYSGNTLATALVGLALYARALMKERRPAYLYAGFAALFLAYFGTHTFIKEHLLPVESRVGHFLGYSGKLPLPFRSLNGLVFNAVLAGLAVAFARRWKDERMVWHCHAIGLPLSVAACLLSGFEPLAAVLTMGAYTIAYGLATWLFAAPPLGYLACAAFAGSAIFGSRYWGDLAAGSRSLSLAAVGALLWLSSRILGMEKVPPSYRLPVVRSSRVITAAALVFASWAAWASPSWTAAIALWSLAGLYLLIALEDPHESIAYAVAGCTALASVLTIQLACDRFGVPVSRVGMASWLAGLGLIYQAAGPRLVDRGRAGIYPLPLFHAGLILAALASWFVVAHGFETYPRISTIDLAGTAATMILIAAGLAIAVWKSDALAYPAVFAGALGVMAAMMAVGSRLGWPPSPSILAVSSGAVGLILVGLGDRLRGAATGWRSSYRRPLLASLFLAIVAAWAFGGLAWQDSPTFTVALALTAVSLAVVVRQLPVRPLPDLSLVAGLAAWLVGWKVLGDRSLEALPRDGLLVLIYGVAVLAIAELARRFAKASDARRAFAASLPEVVGVIAMGGLAMGCVGVWTADFRSLTAALALASIASLWLIRFRREIGLIPIGITLAWLATGGATRWAIGDRAAGILLGWLAMVSAADGLILVALRVLSLRRQVQIAVHPLRDVGILLAAATFAMAIAASLFTLDSYPTAFPALLILVPILILSAAIDRSSLRTYGAIVAAVSASYLTLFELGRNSSGHVSSLGVLASLLAVVCWAMDRGVRTNWRAIFGDPLRYSTVALAIVALLPDSGAPWALLLASLPFLLLIKSLPAAEWLYPALGSLLASAYFAVMIRWGYAGLVPSFVAIAFASWTLGLALWRWKPTVCRRLGLSEDLKLEFPFYHVAMGLGALTLILRLDAILQTGGSWSESLWVPAAVGVLSLLMIKPYPHRGWVDGFVGLLGLSVVAACSSGLISPMSWALLGMILALLWRMVERAAVPSQEEICRRLGVGFDRINEVAHQWSMGLLAVAALPLFARVGTSVLATIFGGPDPFGATTSLEWYEGLLAVLLFGANVEWTLRAMGESNRISLHAMATLMIWWVAVPASPLTPLLMKMRWDLAAVLPLATILQATCCVVVGRSRADRPLGWYGFGLSLIAIVLTGGGFGPATVFTLALAAILMGVVAVDRRNEVAAALASISWLAAFFYASQEIARRLAWNHLPVDATVVGVGQAVASFGLVIAAGWDRRRALGLARVSEGFAAVALAVASGGVLFSILDPSTVGSSQALVNVGVMAAVGSMCVVLASRWSSLPMAFAAQGAILLAYAAFRSGFNLPPSGDSTAILILAGIDLGIAEIAGRGRRLFALPALATGLFLPLISVALSFRNGWIGDEPLFVLFAAGTFYAATCGRMRWKMLGYASAVLYNAALWVMWSRFGWKMAEDPQFYLVPVGFTTILFAEANRHELGRSNVNTIRGIGLTLIYLSLAVPIWQTHSLGAWAAILGVSLVGIFAGIGLRSQAFVWLGLAGFVLDVVYQLGRIGMEHALAKWAIMTCLGLTLFIFVALSEKKRLVGTLRDYVNVVRGWE